MREQCQWAMKDKRLQHYHDTEWGVPIYDDQALFEILSLEIFQAGLTWSLILERRDALRRGLVNFDIDQLAGFAVADEQRLMGDATMIRNHQKLSAVIHNARQWQQQQLGDLSPTEQLWSLQRQFQSQRPGFLSTESKNTFIEQTTALFKTWEIKRVGLKTTTSFLQAAGFINDHAENCFRKKEIYLSVHTTGRISKNMR